MVGLEPTACCLRNSCSTTELHRHERDDTQLLAPPADANSVMGGNRRCPSGVEQRPAAPPHRSPCHIACGTGIAARCESAPRRRASLSAQPSAEFLKVAVGPPLLRSARPHSMSCAYWRWILGEVSPVDARLPRRT